MSCLAQEGRREVRNRELSRQNICMPTFVKRCSNNLVENEGATRLCSIFFLLKRSCGVNCFFGSAPRRAYNPRRRGPGMR
jgi:hypothetical protein